MTATLAAQAPEIRPRARDLGITPGTLSPGPLNAITDVEGVLVGHETIVSGEGALKVGEGPVRTGVTVVRLENQRSPQRICSKRTFGRRNSIVVVTGSP